MLNRYYKCENTKFIFQKWNVMVMTGIVIFVPVMVMTLDSFFGETGEMLCKSKLIQSFYLGQVGYTVLSALFFGNEYQKSALRTSLISTPDRRIFIITKLLCILTWTFIILTLTTIISIITISTVRDDCPGTLEMVRILLPAYISTFEIVIITSCLVVIMRSAIVPMAIIVSLILGLGNILLQYSDKMKYLPVLSVMNGFLVENLPQYPDIETGIFIQAVWSIAAFVCAFILFRKRYVR